MRKLIPILVVIFFLAFLATVLFLNSPLGKESLGWRLEALRAQIKYALNPPQQAIFVPVGMATPMPNTTNTALPLPSNTATLLPTSLPATEPPTPSPSPTQTPTPLPAQAMLSGIRHQYQMWNNCGPANLAMALSFWGWRGDQRQTAAVLKPNPRDKNVMPYEMEAFVEEQTEWSAIWRVGGELDLLKAFLASGFPVIAEKGFEGISFEGWMGHYQVVNGYNDAEGRFYVQDSYNGPNLPIPYEAFVQDWRAFNFTYLVIYPAERLQEVLNLLGMHAYDNFNFRYAAQKALEETQTLSGRDQFFAWFNFGSSMVLLQDYANAAQAYDTAFEIYAQLPEEVRPWRMLWYQTGPYFAYYYTTRYQDVINLATTTLQAMSEPILEESYYWRGMARLALGERQEAIEDFRACLVHHPQFTPCIEQLQALGEQP